jgi:CRP/FNR family transcriptional regulator, cyclic AMP receptor protein
MIGAPQQGPQPRLQLTQRERLDEIVVGAGVEPLDAIVDRVARGEHQHRRAIARRPHAAADLKAVKAGHRDVEDDRVGRRSRHAIQGLDAVGGEVDLVALERQRALQRRAHGRLVVDDQDSHFADRSMRGFLASPPRGWKDPTVAFVSESGTAARRFARPGGQGTVQAVRLLDADRELARRAGSDLPEARAAAVAGCVSIPRGRWSPDAAAERIRGGYGLLVLRGLLMRDLESPEALGAELVAEGDLLGADDGTEERIVGLEPRWEVLEPSRLLVLDAAFAQRIARYPQLATGLVDRVHERARRTAIALALSHLPRVEDRLHRLLWHLADRRGHVRADGIVLRLPVTQEQLGRLVGARRPTVSLALRSLRERGLVHRGEADEWVLANEPPVPES